MSKDHLETLTSEQSEVVLHGCEGDTILAAEPLLVLAGAGTGKTKTLAAFATHRISLGVDPSRILVLAFNLAAAREIDQRISKMVRATAGNRRKGSPRCVTFHAVAFRFVQRYGTRLGLAQNVTIQNRADSARLMESVLAQAKRGKEESFPDAEECLKIYSLRANTLESLKAVLSNGFDKYAQFRPDLRQVFRAYDQTKRANNVLDFDDLLTLWCQLLQHRRIGDRIRGLFDYVLVDEYQDTSPLQDRILRHLRPDGRGLVLVGDDDQCIYGFRGATPTHILDRAERGRVLKLTSSHRSTQPVLDACNAIISQSECRTNKTLWSKEMAGPMPTISIVRDEWAQARHIAERVVHACAQGVTLREQAVLVRTAEEMRPLEAELKRRAIPYRKIGGAHFFDHAGVKTALAILSWRENPSDTVSGTLALQAVPGVDSALAFRVASSFKGRLHRKRLLARRPAVVGRPSWAAFVDLLDNLDQLPWERQVPTVCRWLREHGSGDALGRKMARKLNKLALRCQSRRDFLATANLERAASATGPLAEKDRLTISTIHSAKGREWTAVYIMNAVEGCIPFLLGCREEERRLFFVAMTRAKRHLELLVPKRLRRIGNGSIGLCRTSFISKRALPLFDLNQAGTRSKLHAT
ncbi:ATP-dependent helicase [Bradyrhizobium liaoningense]|uniref:ATP-dependent helicase n=1 Tax=Bradyrhizobium liaoningense TaxID=43992 RepID=UPI001BAB1CDD|nr:ATP-dependent helicase [Bradyrhizobium liaoningense]MBR0838704.1 ATP-dependent helicase [Bradyrhizobium liaoningense]